MTPRLPETPALRVTAGETVTGGQAVIGAGATVRPAAVDLAAVYETVKCMRAARHNPCYRAALYDVMLAIEGMARERGQTIGGTDGKGEHKG